MAWERWNGLEWVAAQESGSVAADVQQNFTARQVFLAGIGFASNEFDIFRGFVEAPPASGVAGYKPGSYLIDLTTGTSYRNTGNETSASWIITTLAVADDLEDLEAAVAELYGPENLPPAPAAMVTTDTTQTVSGDKNFTGALTKSGTELVLATDVRLSDARTPTAHTHPSTAISDSTTTGRAILTAADAAAARLAMGAGTSSFSGDYSALSGIPTSFAPSLHAATHAEGGSDAISIAQSQVISLGTDLAAKYSSANKVPMSGINATGTPNSTNFLRGDGTWSAVSAPSNMMTTDSSQTTLSGDKTSTGNWKAATFSAAGITGTGASSRYVGSTGLTPPATGTFAVGDFVVGTSGSIWICTVAGTPGTWKGVADDAVARALFTTKGDLVVATGNGTVARHAAGTNNHVLTADSTQTNGIKWAAVSVAATGISDSTTVGRSVITAADAAAARTAIGAGTSSFSGAYSALSGIPTSFATTAALISDSTTTGRAVVTATDAAAARTAIGAGTSNFSGAYSALTGIPTNLVTTDTGQVLTAAGIKQFPPGTLLMRNAAGTITAEPYSDVNAPETLMVTKTASTPATPTSGLGVQYTLTTDSRPRFLNDLGEVMVMAQVEPYVMAVTGALTVQTGKSRIYLEGAYVIESIRASVNTAPAGASVIVDVNLNGTSIYGTQANRPTITAGANTALGGAPTSTAVASGQYLTVDVDQIGSTTAGSDLTVVIRLRKV